MRTQARFHADGADRTLTHCVVQGNAAPPPRRCSGRRGSRSAEPPGMALRCVGGRDAMRQPLGAALTRPGAPPSVRAESYDQRSRQRSTACSPTCRAWAASRWRSRRRAGAFWRVDPGAARRAAVPQLGDGRLCGARADLTSPPPAPRAVLRVLETIGAGLGRDAAGRRRHGDPHHDRRADARRRRRGGAGRGHRARPTARSRSASPPTPGANVREAGEDVRAGETRARAGPAAAAGRHRRARVARAADAARRAAPARRDSRHRRRAGRRRRAARPGTDRQQQRLHARRRGRGGGRRAASCIGHRARSARADPRRVRRRVSARHGAVDRRRVGGQLRLRAHASSPSSATRSASGRSRRSPASRSPSACAGARRCSACRAIRCRRWCASTSTSLPALRTMMGLRARASAERGGDAGRDAAQGAPV